MIFIFLGHTTQQEVAKETHQWGPLVRMNCSKYLHIFLCTVYAPVCTIIEEPLPPCRSLCLAAQNGCRELMNRFNVKWPQYLGKYDYCLLIKDLILVLVCQLNKGGWFY